MKSKVRKDLFTLCDKMVASNNGLRPLTTKSGGGYTKRRLFCGNGLVKYCFKWPYTVLLFKSYQIVMRLILHV